MSQILVRPDLTIDLDALREFIHEAKMKAYASGKRYQRDTTTHANKKFLECGSSPWYYRDEYHGSYMAPGIESVWYNNVLVWQMFYAGGIAQPYWYNEAIKNPTLEILKQALTQMPADLPVRGPEDFRADNGYYRSDIKGDITCFGGHEGVALKRELLAKLLGKPLTEDFSIVTFHQFVSGSIVIYKD